MTGEKSLLKLISTMRPQLNEGDYVFCTVRDAGAVHGLDIVGSFREAEGLTIIVERSVAEHAGFTYSYVAAWITLNVHSALEAVGLTAAFSKALGDAGISCNVIAAFYHDHIFVSREDAEKAMAVLLQLSADAKIKP